MKLHWFTGKMKSLTTQKQSKHLFIKFMKQALEISRESSREDQVFMNLETNFEKKVINTNRKPKQLILMDRQFFNFSGYP